MGNQKCHIEFAKSAVTKFNMDPRHFNRIKIVQDLYSYCFNKQKFENEKVNDIIAKTEMIDGLIKKSAPKYEIAKIAKVDLAILRLAIYDLIIEKKEPPKVLINEAIEIAKEMAGEKSPGFINAVLGKIYDEIKDQYEKT